MTRRLTHHVAREQQQGPGQARLGVHHARGLTWRRMKRRTRGQVSVLKNTNVCVCGGGG
jgi:hypothetical protein